MTEILSALGPGLVCLGLGLITAAAAQRALRPPPELPTAPTPPRVVLFEPRRLEDPKVVADRMVADLAAQLCRAGAQPHAGHREGGRQLWVQREEVYGVEQWTVSVLGALVAETDIDRLSVRIADVIRDWRARDAAEREERDVRWGAR